MLSPASREETEVELITRKSQVIVGGLASRCFVDNDPVTTKRARENPGLQGEFIRNVQTGAIRDLYIVAVAIKLTSKGPVFFSQTRVGYLGRPFTFLKFRTMEIGCDEEIHRTHQKKFIEGQIRADNGADSSRPIFKVPDDPRITRIGHFLRRTSLDELPQLFHVLQGTMSLVGPRPPIPYEVEIYENWHRRRVLEANPGITGLWQIHRTSITTFGEMVRYDLRYINEQSIGLDLKILLRTFPVVMNRRFLG